MGLLLAGLADRSLLTREATEDRIHQDYRSPLFPEAPKLLAKLVDAGALASCWSGAGPTLLAICDGADQEKVRGKARDPPWPRSALPVRHSSCTPTCRDSPRTAPGPPTGFAVDPGRCRPARSTTSSTTYRQERSGAAAPSAYTGLVSRTFHIRTFGCQMNEHDSERLAGLLVADGMERASDLETADVVILNTCCVRENADNRLYGHLGHLKSLKARHPGMQIAVGGCLAQKDRELLRERAPQVDLVFGTHNLASAPGLLRRVSVEGPLVDVLDEPVAGGDPAHASALERGSRPSVVGMGHDPDRLRQFLCVLHRAGGAWPRGEPSDRRSRERGRVAQCFRASPRSRFSART